MFGGKDILLSFERNKRKDRWTHLLRDVFGEVLHVKSQ